MNLKGQEIEVKFLVSDLAGLEARLRALGANPVQPRQFELNLRYDTPKGKLTKAHQVLRLRQDSKVKIAYKGPGELHEGARLRQELEFEVSDFETAQKVLEALGFEVSVIYEKYRAAYRLGAVEVTLDELPFGNFCEIEGPGGSVLHAAAEELGLDWEKRVLSSYLSLFNQIRKKMGLSFRDLSFANFKGLAVEPADLKVEFADRQGG